MVNPLARQVSIDLITDTFNPIIKWFNDIWNQINIIETAVYHSNGGELIYYVNIDGINKWIFFQDNKNNKFWCDYKNYWSIFESKFNPKYTEIQTITKLLVENALNNTVTTPRSSANRKTYGVENALNNTVTTPPSKTLGTAIKVENALNNTVTTPVIKSNISPSMVENALNNTVTTPHKLNMETQSMVENALNNSVTTPSLLLSEYNYRVENALNNRVTTSSLPIPRINSMVENSLNNNAALSRISKHGK